MPNFELAERQKNSVVILDLKGRIIFGEGSKELHRKFRQLVEIDEKQILLNFSEVTCIDSSGLGELVGGFVAEKRIGGEIRLFNLSANVFELFELTKLNVVFEVYQTEDEAMESFLSKPQKSVSVSPVV